jgi:VIT1/CCC1 family predicted Fe2+/Mn2+ transporter
MSDIPSHDPKVAETLILDEIFDLALYKELREMSDGRLRALLDDLILIETTHVTFWQKFFNSPLTTMDLRRRIKLRLTVIACRVFGAPAIHLVLEAIEVYGVRKYLSIWKSYRDQPLGAAVKGILIDEFKHEDVIVSQLTERRINPEQIRNIFLGLNDGLVEILGAVSGFFAAFGDAATVLIAGATTAAAGSLSMTAGAYVALSSEGEIQATEDDKKRFLGEASLPGNFDEESLSRRAQEPPFGSSLLVGGSYFVGATVPLLPVVFGATNAWLSMLTAGTVIILVSTLLAFLSGMNIKRRIMTNLVIIAAAVGVTYAIGRVVKDLLGISI